MLNKERIHVEAEIPSTLSQDRRKQVESDLRNTLGRADAQNIQVGWGETTQDEAQNTGRSGR